MKATFIRPVLAIGTLVIASLTNGCRKTINDIPGVKSDVLPNTTGDINLFQKQTDKYVQNELLVQFKPGTSEQEISQVLQRVRGTITEKVLTKAMEYAGDKDGFYIVHVSVDAMQAVAALKGAGGVVVAEPNYIYTYGAAANDPYFTSGNLWGMYSASSTAGPVNQYGCQADLAWAAGHTGSSSVIVGVVDEGVMNTHEDLQANCWVNPYDPVDGIDNDGNGYKDDKWGWDFVNNNNTTFDGVSDDHATHVAGTIGAVGNNSKGVAGVCWNVKIISCKFLGTYGGTTANAIKAIDYVTDMKTRHSMNIVATNNSWGGGGYSTLLYNAIDRANTANILFVAAAGNSSANNDAVANYPSNYPNDNVIAVAAIKSTGASSSFSNYGATMVDIGAPGETIYSTLPAKSTGNRVVSSYGSYSGTSMATPHVTGAAALYAATHPGSSAAVIKTAILSNATPTPSLTGKCVSNGRLNVSGF